MRRSVYATKRSMAQLTIPGNAPGRFGPWRALRTQNADGPAFELSALANWKTDPRNALIA
jgi:hypothetical protein